MGSHLLLFENPAHTIGILQQGFEGVEYNSIGVKLVVGDTGVGWHTFSDAFTLEKVCQPNPVSPKCFYAPVINSK